MTVNVNEKKLLFSTPRERKPLIIDKVEKVLTEIEKEGEVCGFVFFAFMPSGEGVETWAEYEGLCNPEHILEALEQYGIIRRIQI